MHTNISLQQLRYIIEVAECGSINAASQQLYVSQPTLSATIKDTEQELGISIFNRTNRGITLTSEGTEFIGYARQILEQFDLFEARYSNTHNSSSGRLAISSQHYAFCVEAFVDLAEEYNEKEYDFSLRETRTADIIDDVKDYRSELGIIYLSDFNSKVLTKAFSDAGLTFVPLFQAHPHIFVGKQHPLAQRKSVTPDDLQDYPRYSFEQGTNNSFFFSEEPLSHLPHRQNITYSDRGTLTNLLTNHNGYTITTGVRSGEMGQSNIVAIPLEVDETMTVGYVCHESRPLSTLAKRYLEKLRARIEANPTVSTYYPYKQ
ncbi:MAG: LysR family transcriptional regulator [Eggerthellaceae bacterium]|nr:LysR family transcriptional regulator [Eggerthellaceae bacterium]